MANINKGRGSWQRLLDRLTWIAVYLRAATITAARAIWTHRDRDER